MKLVQITTRKPVGTRQWLQWYGLFKCPYCDTEKEMLLSNGKRAKSCGCKRGTHNMSRTRLYKIWEDIKKRCDNPNTKHYNRYGGRGITYDKSWSKFENFYSDMKEGYDDTLTIDRINNDGHYNQENCVWISKQKNSGKDHKGRKQNEEWINKRIKSRLETVKQRNSRKGK